MSAQYFQSDTPQEQQFIKCGALTVRGALIANKDVAVSGTIQLPALTKYTQITSTSTNVTITGAEQQFAIDTFATGSIAAGATATFSVFHSGYEVGKTLVLIANDVSDNTLLTTNCFVAYGGAGAFIITRHNVGAVAQADKQTIIVKLIQSA